MIKFAQHTIRIKILLSLDSPEWRALTHAYGAASDIPKLLRVLETQTGPGAGGESRPWIGPWADEL